ncbi:bile salt sulfotransferase 1-like [Microtus ochrogaster]|uniref:Sulfotransferase n=1 Tax=Microtus ochrogaster TaxID=79684 RepID=A0ABM0L8K3_MICOH|nr:bile salt sulfotransferase 1-like [Microtus ochrogaster]
MSDYLWFEGIPFPAIGIEKEILGEIGDKFVVRDEDTIMLTYPKSGTNWLIEIVCLIQTKGNPKWIQSVPIWERSPWVESEYGYQTLINKEGPRLFSSHLPFHLFPKSFFSSKAKMIYVIRNPRDVLVSGYFFLQKTNLIKNPESLINYFEWFLKGNVIFGSWFEHTRAWLSMRERDNFLLLSYEDLKQWVISQNRPDCVNDQMSQETHFCEDVLNTVGYAVSPLLSLAEYQQLSSKLSAQ